ncbi:diguanylate cyclase (GGDEF) domain-containing protein [Pseudobutyrivibrio sp. ACV-2]|uniref:GGDEF domain-containing protein n=1 Tax=Pseudobutyrivibrio sp. ACV-2 TaxID=1520801 RepID=UPI00089BD6BF|nr:GGDEF domain-containing protein [Pseudobutyrivibrio sp. ACV-2]SEA71213.1 diguanylate cyclase (GGDEF) domain-containing protein [Pseudobutyrivibrio sp. ACV-2]
MFKLSNLKGVKRRVNIVILIICALLLGACYFLTPNETCNNSHTKVIKPYTVANLPDGSKEYYFDLVDYDYKYSGIMFYTSHQFVQVHNAGKLIYSFDTPGGFWGSTPGANYNFVEVNEKMLHVAVSITPAYPQVADQDIVFYIGSSYQMYKDILVRSMPRFIASMLIILFSIILFVYYIAMRKKQNLGREIVHLAFFSFFLGSWTLNESAVEVLINKSVIFDSLVPYFCLMLVIPPFVLFVDEYLELKSNAIRTIILSLSIIQSSVLTVLHFTKILEFRQSLVFIHVMLVIAAVYALSGVLIQVSRQNMTHHVIVMSIGLSLMLLALLVDIVKYYTHIGDSDYLGRYLFLVLVVLLAWDLIRDTYEIIEKGRRAKELEVFALTDSMTGLFNRNAFETHVRMQNSIDGVTVVVADANGLKKCNDTYGHDVGDVYITTVANLFNKVYGKYGSCYRTGGDEFCCIIPSNKSVDVDRLKSIFAAKIYNTNLEGEYDFNIGVAVGHAKYNSAVDSDFKSLIKRADTHMYENKKESKRIS